jgi:hypothetical protein
MEKKKEAVSKKKRGKPGPVEGKVAQKVTAIIETFFSLYLPKFPPTDPAGAARIRLQGLVETGSFGAVFTMDGWPKSGILEYGVALQMDKLSIVSFTVEMERKEPLEGETVAPRARDQVIERWFKEIFCSHRIPMWGDAFD